MFMSPFSFFSHLLGITHHPKTGHNHPATEWQVGDDGMEQWQSEEHGMTLSPVGLTEPQNQSRTLCSQVYSRRDKQSPVRLSTDITKDLGLPTLLLVDSWSQVTSDLEVRTAFTLTYCCWFRGTLWKYHFDNTCLLSECHWLEYICPQDNETRNEGKFNQSHWQNGIIRI